MRSKLLGIPAVQRSPPLSHPAVPQPFRAALIRVRSTWLRRQPLCTWHERRVSRVARRVLAKVNLSSSSDTEQQLTTAGDAPASVAELYVVQHSRRTLAAPRRRQRRLLRNWRLQGQTRRSCQAHALRLHAAEQQLQLAVQQAAPAAARLPDRWQSRFALVIKMTGRRIKAGERSETGRSPVRVESRAGQCRMYTERQQQPNVYRYTTWSESRLQLWRSEPTTAHQAKKKSWRHSVNRS